MRIFLSWIFINANKLDGNTAIVCIKPCFRTNVTHRSGLLQDSSVSPTGLPADVPDFKSALLNTEIVRCRYIKKWQISARYIGRPLLGRQLRSYGDTAIVLTVSLATVSGMRIAGFLWFSFCDVWLKWWNVEILVGLRLPGYLQWQCWIFSSNMLHPHPHPFEKGNKMLWPWAFIITNRVSSLLWHQNTVPFFEDSYWF